MTFTKLAWGFALKSAVLVAMALSLNATTNADIVDVEVDTEFNAESEFEGTYTYYSYVFKLGANTVTTDFSQVGDQSLTFNFHAPDDRRFVFDGPSSGTNLKFGMIFSQGAGGTITEDFHFDFAPVINFQDFQGNALGAPDGSSFSLADYQDAESSVSAYATIPVNVGESFSFSSVSIQTTVPAAYDGSDFADTANAYLWAQVDYSSANDPGKIFGLSAVPEPSSATVLLGIAVCALSRRRNRAVVI